MHAILGGAERDKEPNHLIRDLCITFGSAVVAIITFEEYRSYTEVTKERCFGISKVTLVFVPNRCT